MDGVLGGKESGWMGDRENDEMRDGLNRKRIGREKGMDGDREQEQQGME